MQKAEIFGWGRYPRLTSQLISLRNEADAHKALQAIGQDFVIPIGQGKSYGDSALQTNVLRTDDLNCLISFDPTTGFLEAESGLTLKDLIDIFLPQGFFVPVTPGTKYVSLGGAIAFDVHGKNHHVAGCFSEFVDYFDLLTAPGQVYRCSRNENADLFHATCGGAGLTGIILRVGMRLLRVQSTRIEQTSIKACGLKEMYDLFVEKAASTYSVAWIDSSAQGKKLGRGLFIFGEHSQVNDLKYSKKKFTISMPVDAPSFCMNSASIKIFNELYYHKQQRKKVSKQVSIDTFFYPLDQILNWNRVYGSAGFTQYQMVLPQESSYSGIQKFMQMCHRFGSTSFLTVLKLFGPQNANPLSFPTSGMTLTIDFKVTSGLMKFLDELDALILDHGGRVYLAKDCRLSAATFRKFYPRWQEFTTIREKYHLTRFASLQSRRIGL